MTSGRSRDEFLAAILAAFAPFPDAPLVVWDTETHCEVLFGDPGGGLLIIPRGLEVEP